MKLYDIDKAILDCIDGETGEIVDFENLNKLQRERSVKMENLALWYKDLIAEAEALKNEKEMFAKREKSARNRADSIKRYLCLVLNGDSFKTEKCVCSFRKSERIVIDDVFKIPETYLSYLEPKANLSEIKKAIKNGEEISGAHVEENRSILIK